MEKENTCVIYDKDEKYAQRLMGAFNERSNTPFGVQMFTEEKELINYLDCYSPEVLMVSEDSFTYEIGKKHDGKLMILCDDESTTVNTEKEYGENAEGIYKYQSSERIVKSVIGSAKARVSIVGIYSFVDFRGKVEFGIEYAYELAQTEKVLYVNFEEFSELMPVLLGDNNLTMSDALYFYKQYGGYTPKIKKTINSLEALDYISPVSCANDIAFVSADEVIRMLEDIGDKLEYDYIVVDMGNAVRQPWRMIRGCSLVYMPVDKKNVPEIRMSQFEVYCMESGAENILAKIRRVDVNPECVDSILPGDNYRETIGNGKMNGCVRKLIYD